MNKLQAVVSAAIAGIPAVAYRLPGENRIILGWQDYGRPGGRPLWTFHVNRFATPSCRNVTIKVNVEDEAQRLIASTRKRSVFSLDLPSFVSTTQEDYLAGIKRVIASVRRRNGKTVVSRVIRQKVDLKKLPEVTEALWKAFPDTFGCLFYTPETGLWLMATPELLVKVKDGLLHTMSLAGTRSVSTPSPSWDEKNLREHQIVTDCICQTLRESGLSPIVSGDSNMTLRYGNIEHLYNPIKAVMPQDTDVWKLLDTLSPTPALCGYPRQQALRDIALVESHERECYGGYVAIQNRECLQAWVNLRTMRAGSSEGLLYVGGGIMPDSNPAEEWKETTAKASRMLSILEKI